MSDLTHDQLIALVQSGATNREIEATIGRDLNKEERAEIDRARAIKRLKRAVKKKDPKGYEGKKEYARKREAELSLSGREIGELPSIVNPDRKKNGDRNFRAFCEQYFPMTFNLAWSADHIEIA